MNFDNIDGATKFKPFLDAINKKQKKNIYRKRN